MKKFKCTICGYIYDEEKGIPEKGINPGTKWEDLGDDWKCPLCGAPKNAFVEIENESIKETPTLKTSENKQEEQEVLREVSFGELAAICSNLAKGCDKQYLENQSQLFLELAAYFNSKNKIPENGNYDDLISKINNDLSEKYGVIKDLCTENQDRGTLRAVTWGEKATYMLKSLLERYKSEGNNFLENTNVYVCDICGFIYIGNEVPSVCPICKVPSLKILLMKGVE